MLQIKKSLGQNFLQNDGVLSKIVDALDVGPDDNIIEIGPGHGELTRKLTAGGKRPHIIAIEKDGRLAAVLRDEFKASPNVEVIASDALKLLPAIVPDTGYKVVGNIPYYITGHLLRVLATLEPKPKSIILMVQKEVAERICAGPPRMNLLAGSVQFWARPEILMLVGRENFHPKPGVDSAVVKIVPKRRSTVDPDVFYPFLRMLFKQPRKTILNNLMAVAASDNTKSDIVKEFGRFGIDPGKRPQDLTFEDIEKLADKIRPVKNA